MIKIGINKPSLKTILKDVGCRPSAIDQQQLKHADTEELVVALDMLYDLRSEFGGRDDLSSEGRDYLDISIYDATNFFHRSYLAVYLELRDREEYEALLEYDGCAASLFMRFSIPEAFEHAMTPSCNHESRDFIIDSVLHKATDEDLSKSLSDEDLLRIYRTGLKSGEFAYSPLKLVDVHWERIRDSPLYGEFIDAMHQYRDPNLAKYVAKDIAEKLPDVINTEEDQILLAEALDLAGLVREYLNSDLYDDLQQRYDGSTVEKKALERVQQSHEVHVLRTVHDLATKVEQQYGVSIPQKGNVMVTLPDGTYGQISLTEGDNEKGGFKDVANA